MSDSTQWIVQNNLDELERLKADVETFGAEHNFHVEEEYAIHLCLEEMVSNVINYAWPEGGDHEFVVKLSVDDAHIQVEIEDNGIEFDPTKMAPPTSGQAVEDRPIGGLGIHLVSQTADDLFYQRFEGKNHLIIKKKRKEL